MTAGFPVMDATDACVAGEKMTPPPLRSPVVLRDRFVWYRLLLRRERGLSGAPYLFAPSGSAEAVLFARTGSSWSGKFFGHALPWRGPALYRGSPVIGVPTAWLDDRPMYVGIAGGLALRRCFRIEGADAVLDGARPDWIIVFYFGLLCAIVLYNVLISLTTREPAFAWYLLYLAMLGSYQLVRSNYAWPLLWPHSSWDQNSAEFYLYCITVAAHAQFSRIFLQAKSYAARLDRWVISIIIALLMTPPAATLSYRLTAGIPWPVIIATLFLAQIGVTAAVAVLRIRRGYRPAVFFLFSYPVLAVFTGMAFAQYLIGTTTFLTTYGVELGTAAEALLLTLAIGDRLRYERGLRAVTRNAPDLISRLRPDGTIAFISENSARIVGYEPGQLNGTRFEDIVVQQDRETFSKALQSLTYATPIPQLLVNVRTREDSVAALELSVRIASDPALGRSRSLLLSARDVTARREAEDQLARSAELASIGNSDESSLNVRIFEGRVLRGRHEIRLAPRERELLTALALRADPAGSDQLEADLWPDRERESAHNAFHIALTRLRSKLGSNDAIVYREGRYGLAPAVSVDAREAQRIISAARNGLTPQLRASLRCASDRTAHELPASLLRCEWFLPYEPMLSRIRSEIGRLAVEDYLREGRHDAALAVAERLVNVAPADESAYEFLVRAHLAGGDRLAAQRAYRACSEMMRSQYSDAPSTEFGELLERAYEPVALTC